MKDIFSFSDKSLWSQNNNEVNIWFCDQSNVFETNYIKNLFEHRPFFIFHSQVSLVQGICEALNFSDEKITIIDELIKGGERDDRGVKHCKFFLHPYGYITVNFIR